MKFKNFLEETLYLEAERLLGTFTFGFELEGWIEDIDVFDEFETWTYNISKKFDIAEGKEFIIKDDISINPDGFPICVECEGSGVDIDDFECPECEGSGVVYEEYSGDYKTFEIASPVLKLTPLNISKTIYYLKTAVEEYEVETNETCGMHIHLGFPEIKEGKTNSINIFWALCHLASTPDEASKILNYKGFKLYGKKYAKLKVLENMHQMISRDYFPKDVSKDVVLNTLNRFYNDDKFLVFRQHTIGTLEWRGPRGFLDRPNLIKDFFIKVLYGLVKFLNDSLDEDRLNFPNLDISYITKEEFYKYFLSKRDYPAKKIDPNRKFVDMSGREIEDIYRKFGRILAPLNFTKATLSILNDELFIHDMYLLGGTLKGVKNIRYLTLNKSPIVRRGRSSNNNYNGSIENCYIKNINDAEYGTIKNSTIEYIDESTDLNLINCNINFLKDINAVNEFVIHNTKIEQIRYINSDDAKLIIKNNSSIKFFPGFPQTIENLNMTNSHLEIKSTSSCVIKKSYIENSNIHSSTIDDLEIISTDIKNSQIQNSMLKNSKINGSIISNCYFEGVGNKISNCNIINPYFYDNEYFNKEILPFNSVTGKLTNLNANKEEEEY